MTKKEQFLEFIKLGILMHAVRSGISLRVAFIVFNEAIGIDEVIIPDNVGVAARDFLNYRFERPPTDAIPSKPPWLP